MGFDWGGALISLRKASFLHCFIHCLCVSGTAQFTPPDCLSTHTCACKVRKGRWVWGKPWNIPSFWLYINRGLEFWWLPLWEVLGDTQVAGRLQENYALESQGRRFKNTVHKKGDLWHFTNKRGSKLPDPSNCLSKCHLTQHWGEKVPLISSGSFWWVSAPLSWHSGCDSRFFWGHQVPRMGGCWFTWRARVALFLSQGWAVTAPVCPECSWLRIPQQKVISLSKENLSGQGAKVTPRKGLWTFALSFYLWATSQSILLLWYPGAFPLSVVREECDSPTPKISKCFTALNTDITCCKILFMYFPTMEILDKGRAPTFQDGKITHKGT